MDSCPERGHEGCCRCCWGVGRYQKRGRGELEGQGSQPVAKLVARSGYAGKAVQWLNGSSSLPLSNASAMQKDYNLQHLQCAAYQADNPHCKPNLDAHPSLSLSEVVNPYLLGLLQQPLLFLLEPVLQTLVLRYHHGINLEV